MWKFASSSNWISNTLACTVTDSLGGIEANSSTRRFKRHELGPPKGENGSVQFLINCLQFCKQTLSGCWFPHSMRVNDGLKSAWPFLLFGVFVFAMFVFLFCCIHLSGYRCISFMFYCCIWIGFSFYHFGKGYNSSVYPSSLLVLGLRDSRTWMSFDE